MPFDVVKSFYSARISHRSPRQTLSKRSGHISFDYTGIIYIGCMTTATDILHLCAMSSCIYGGYWLTAFDVAEIWPDGLVMIPEKNTASTIPTSKAARCT